MITNIRPTLYTLITGTILALGIIYYTYAEIAVDRAKLNNINRIKRRDAMQYPDWEFQNFMLQFDPSTVWEKIDKQQKLQGKKLNPKEYLEAMLKGIDESDQLLKLEVKNGDAKMLIGKDGRRWQPPPGLTNNKRDRFSLRPRLFELMKQSIYQARNKMVIMQILRDRFRTQSLYKMGFLMSKTDSACKTFAQFAFRAFRSCRLSREVAKYGVLSLYDLLVVEERMLHLWFDIELLTDLVRENDETCKDMLIANQTNRKTAWKFVD